MLLSIIFTVCIILYIIYRLVTHKTDKIDTIQQTYYYRTIPIIKPVDPCNDGFIKYGYIKDNLVIRTKLLPVCTGYNVLISNNSNLFNLSYIDDLITLNYDSPLMLSFNNKFMISIPYTALSLSSKLTTTVNSSYIWDVTDNGGTFTIKYLNEFLGVAGSNIALFTTKNETCNWIIRAYILNTY
jgi:phage tail protein X